MTQIKYDVSGIGNFQVWKAICKNIVAQKDLYVVKLKDSADITRAVASSYSNQADYQYNQLEDQKQALIAQGYAGIAAGATSAAVELGTLLHSFKLDVKADGIQKDLDSEDEIGSANFEEIDPSVASPTGSSSSASPTDGAGKSVELQKEDGIVADVSKASANDKVQVQAEQAQRDVEVQDEQADLVVRKETTQKEQAQDLLSEKEARDSIDNKDKKREIKQLRNQAQGWRLGGSALAQAVSSICSGIGALVQSAWKDHEATDTKMATLYQGAGTVLQQIIQQIQSMEQAVDTSQQGTLSTLASLIAASIIRG